jgi:hypothetical protein
LLRVELQFYEEHRAELLARHHGQFALVVRDALIGTYPTLGTAYEEGIRKFGNIPMLIRQILPVDPAYKVPVYTQGLLRADL